MFALLGSVCLAPVGCYSRISESLVRSHAQGSLNPHPSPSTLYIWRKSSNDSTRSPLPHAAQNQNISRESWGSGRRIPDVYILNPLALTKLGLPQEQEDPSGPAWKAALGNRCSPSLTGTLGLFFLGKWGVTFPGLGYRGGRE